MASDKRRIHTGLILASGLLGVSLSVLILGASRGQAKDAGLPGSDAVSITLPDTAGHATAVLGDDARPVVLLVARKDLAPGGTLGGEVRQVAETFSKDASVRLVGVQVPTDTGLLSDSVRVRGVLETAGAGLMTLTDADGAVARAYRVSDGPTAFVVDARHVIRGRFPLDRDGAAMAIAETVAALRPAADVPAMSLGR